MKKNILSIILACFCLSIYGQMKTKVTGTIPEYSEKRGEVILNVFDPSVIGQGRKVEYKKLTSGGNFEFELEINETLSISGKLNEKPLLFPGTYSILINPGDSIHIEIPDVKKLGILDLKFSGNGSDKVNFQKEIVAAKIALFKKDPEYSSQSLGYKFFTTDRKLDAIDSVCKNYRGNIKKTEKELIKANEYDGILDILMIACMNSKSDSLKWLFNKYLLKKNRMAPFLTNKNISYFGFTVMREFVLLSEFDNPIKHGGVGIRTDNPVAYCKLVIKHLSKYPTAKEYLLTSAALNVFADEQDSENSRRIYQLYSDNVRHDSPFYRTVRDRYQIVISRLKKGMVFYPFTLPDTIGKLHQLADFRGKVVLLDFWFNGCGGCRVLAPVMDKLEKEYGGKDIQFISVSIDSDKSWWLKGIGKYSSNNSLQLFTEGLETEHPLVKFLNPGGYPFLIAIDKNGNLIGPPPNPVERKAEFKRFIDPFL